MSYLIIPPIIVIVSLALLIWFLSNRAKLPSIQERMADIAESSSFREWQTLRFKQVFFRFLEKSMRTLKVLSLRIHNAFHSMGQSFREKRYESDLLVTSIRNSKKEHDDTPAEAAASPITFSDVPEPVFPELKRVKRVIEPEESRPVVAASIPESRPMVSERMVIPEPLPPQPVRDNKEEERLIKKIAANPKNVSAYEALGDYYLDRGDVNDAKSCYRQVLKLSPVHRMVKIKIRKLERLMEEQKQSHGE